MIQDPLGDEIRGTGVTSAQMMESPLGAWYICPNREFARGYGCDLAVHLGRHDLTLAGPHCNLIGLDGDVVVDHAAHLTNAGRRTVTMMQERALAKRQSAA